MRKDRSMIGLTRTNGELCRLDPAHIQRIEEHPTTVVYLLDGAKYCVLEDVGEITRRVRECRARAMIAVYRLVDGAPASGGCRAPVPRPRTAPDAARPRDEAAVMPLRSRSES
jgi:flagellar protein FlbD